MLICVFTKIRNWQRMSHNLPNVVRKQKENKYIKQFKMLAPCSFMFPPCLKMFQMKMSLSLEPIVWVFAAVVRQNIVKDPVLKLKVFVFFVISLSKTPPQDPSKKPKNQKNIFLDKDFQLYILWIHNTLPVWFVRLQVVLNRPQSDCELFIQHWLKVMSIKLNLINRIEGILSSRLLRPTGFHGYVAITHTFICTENKSLT